MHLLGPLYRNGIKPLLFRFDPESVHDRMLTAGRLLGAIPPARFLTRLALRFDHPVLSQTVSGVLFPNPVGLSAGFDKNAELTRILPAVGFGYSELGSVTWKPYQGNPRPRLTRLPKSKAIVVYYGLKNIGVERILPRIPDRGSRHPFSISIAKTNSEATARTEDGIEDYYQCMKTVLASNKGDILTINISCPNTFGGEPFTTPERLDALLSRLDTLHSDRPVWIKMPINQTWDEFRDLLVTASDHKVDGVVIGNLTKARDPGLILDDLSDDVKGGISGVPTRELSNNLISRTFQEFGQRFTIIGVGGIFSAEDAYEKIRLGATLLQMITGMIYEGPQIIGEINKGLAELLRQDGYASITEAVGSAHTS
ncbi:MAG: Dihydroorotate dehydrogenase (quinone) [candidate division WS6 bacterium OLB20]|uniref:Dihydroorotate dehydrogenase (quinone) n=1 Tax=candidate division WS6 bacterium OLB20 TaxID=1617426 RepID=A0A136M0P0_9BACT|nr:MAG: Dihydroorotate dehydrogenase (quinone) [candidate division WS6 bacterium OLB20]